MSLINFLGRKFKERAITPLRRRRMLRTLPPLPPPPANLLRLGTKYGGWEFIDAAYLHGATIVSGGAGEDISFDIEFARRYGANIVVVDPTPRARAHVTSVLARIDANEPAAGPLAHRGGQVDPWTYDISGLHVGQIKLVPFALWPAEGEVEFYEPVGQVDDSHSIANLQSSQRVILVRALPLHKILAEQGITTLALMKLDIEGAEIEVLQDMLARAICPTQLLVEFDELHMPSRRSQTRVRPTIDLLVKYGYKFTYFNGQANFLFVKEQ